MERHTKGPWLVTSCSAIPETTKFVCTFTTNTGVAAHNELRANVNLLQCTHGLLEALSGLLDATSGGMCLCSRDEYCSVCSKSDKQRPAEQKARAILAKARGDA